MFQTISRVLHFKKDHQFTSLFPFIDKIGGVPKMSKILSNVLGITTFIVKLLGSKENLCFPLSASGVFAPQLSQVLQELRKASYTAQMRFGCTCAEDTMDYFTF